MTPQRTEAKRLPGMGTVCRMLRRGDEIRLTLPDGTLVGTIGVKQTSNRGARIAMTMRREIRIQREGAPTNAAGAAGDSDGEAT
jgi:hypothetical protein